MKYVSSNKKDYFKEEWINHIDYKNTWLLLNFVDYFGRIKKSYYTWTTRKNQAKLSKAIKRARHMALLKFTR